MATRSHGRVHLPACERHLRSVLIGIAHAPLVASHPHSRLLGGSGSFGTSSWFAGYNLPEAMGYVGLLPVVGAFALLGRLRFGRPFPDWLVWHVIALVGIILAIGSFTPLGHVMAALPLFGGQRLQSRNIAITDLALAVLLAYWVDDVLKRPDLRIARDPGAASGADPSASGFWASSPSSPPPCSPPSPSPTPSPWPLPPGHGARDHRCCGNNDRCSS